MRPIAITNSITRRDEMSIGKYLAEISAYAVLTPDEELAQFKAYRNGDEEALQKIVRHNLRFVVSVAKQYQQGTFSLGDLISEGNIGLMKAARRFDETKGFKFISYAVWWIRQSILQALNEKSNKIRLPLNVKGSSLKILAKRTDILQRTEREPTVDELAEATGLTPKVVKRCMDTYRMCSSLDAPVQEDSYSTLGNLIEDTSIKRPDHQVTICDSQKEEIRQMLELLPERQATVLRLFFGINQELPLSLDDISGHLGVSRERVRQIKDKGLDRLRRKATSMIPTFDPN